MLERDALLKEIFDNYIYIHKIYYKMFASSYYVVDEGMLMFVLIMKDYC